MEIPVRWHSLLQGVHSSYCVEISLSICAFVTWKPVLEQMLVCACVSTRGYLLFSPWGADGLVPFSEHCSVILFGFPSAHPRDANFFNPPFLVLLVGLACGWAWGVLKNGQPDAGPVETKGGGMVPVMAVFQWKEGACFFVIHLRRLFHSIGNIKRERANSHLCKCTYFNYLTSWKPLFELQWNYVMMIQSAKYHQIWVNLTFW